MGVLLLLMADLNFGFIIGLVENRTWSSISGFDCKLWRELHTHKISQTGLLGAFVIKKLYFARHWTNHEVALMMPMAYLSYMLAEVRFPSTLGLLQKLFYYSGILTIFFCGIVMSISQYGCLGH